MYEISPYATFSMAGGATGPGERAEEPLVAAGTLRTFGRAEALALAAPPPRAHAHKHRSPTNSGEARDAPSRRDRRRNTSRVADEYTLSRAMTLMVRPSESDSESSGSPCAECNSSSASYRMPVAPSKGSLKKFYRHGAVFRPGRGKLELGGTFPFESCLLPRRKKYTGRCRSEWGLCCIGCRGGVPRGDGLQRGVGRRAQRPAPARARARQAAARAAPPRAPRRQVLDLPSQRRAAASQQTYYCRHLLGLWNTA